MLRLITAVLFLALPAIAQTRVPVSFEITQTTTFGQSVFLLGEIDELGGGDLSRAIKLDPSGYPTWRLSVAIPAGIDYTYRYYVREDAPGRTSDPTNGTPVTAELSGSTPPAADPGGKVVLARMEADQATLHWKHPGDAEFQQVPMRRVAPGEGEWRAELLAWGFAGADETIEFFIETEPGAVLPGDREPPFAGTHTISRRAVYAQAGQLFSYRPAPEITPARRDYAPSSPPTIQSAVLGESRRYRVYLPRGYDEHTDRTYPLVIFHDGQNVFESGPFGSWNADDVIEPMTRAGEIREAVYVGVDHTDRFRDYIPEPGGRADDYVRFLTDELIPHIAANYRVRTDAPSVASIGSSLGGVIAMHMGWNHPDDFGLVGAMSGAWQVTTDSLNAQLAGEPARDIRIYMDSGDSGPSNDNYWRSYSIRDALAGTGSPRYSLEGDLRHVVGFGDSHNETAWNRRLPEAIAFLLDPSWVTPEILTGVFGPQLDVDASGRVDIDDLYLQTQSPRDLDLDGGIDAEDTGYLEGFLRGDEAYDVRQPARR